MLSLLLHPLATSSTEKEAVTKMIICNVQKLHQVKNFYQSVNNCVFLDFDQCFGFLLSVVGSDVEVTPVGTGPLLTQSANWCNLTRPDFQFCFLNHSCSGRTYLPG